MERRTARHLSPRLVVRDPYEGPVVKADRDRLRPPVELVAVKGAAAGGTPLLGAALSRFTPRKARSKWSQVNRTRASELLDAGRVRPRGLAQIDAAKADGRWDAAYAPASKAEVPADLQAALDGSPEAEAFFATLTGANRYAILYRIGAVKKPETRARKIADFVAMLGRHEAVHG
jgi:uncharacterized protein YdeI (YjbR/CyaY-like superfamily)